MKIMMRAVFCLLLCLTCSANAQTRQFNNVIYTTPQGWTGSYANGPWIMLIPDDAQNTYCQGCYFYIATGAPGAWDATSYLATQLHAFVDPGKYTAQTIVQTPSAVAIAGRPGAMLVTSVDGKLLFTLAVTLKDRVELFGFEGPGSDQSESANTVKVFGERFEPFVKAMGFVSEGAAPLFPAASPGPLDGLWWGIKPVWKLQYRGLSNSTQMALVYDQRFLTFWPDGQVYEGTPPNGLASVDRKALLQAGDLSFGVYSVAAETLHLTWSDGRTEDLPMSGNVVTDGSGMLDRVTPLADGSAIDGQASVYYARSRNGPVGASTVSMMALYFPDGHWQSSDGTQFGTYGVTDGLVTLTFADQSAPISLLVFRGDAALHIADQILEPRG
ncbi:MAG: hypothetical protein ABI459_04190 [Deltaproteobacteria bacterium]